MLQGISCQQLLSPVATTMDESSIRSPCPLKSLPGSKRRQLLPLNTEKLPNQLRREVLFLAVKDLLQVSKLKQQIASCIVAPWKGLLSKRLRTLLRDDLRLRMTAKQRFVLYTPGACCTVRSPYPISSITSPILSQTKGYDSRLLNVGAQNKNHIKLTTTQLTFDIPSSSKSQPNSLPLKVDQARRRTILARPHQTFIMIGLCR